jgi:hypothetical protein
MKRRKLYLAALLGCAAILVALYPIIHWVEEAEYEYQPLPGQLALAKWGSPPHDLELGVATIDEIEQVFGEPAKRLDNGRTRVWRGTYCDAVYIYRRWLYRRKLVRGHETFIPYTIIATFDEKGVLTSWRRPIPTEVLLPHQQARLQQFLAGEPEE